MSFDNACRTAPIEIAPTSSSTGSAGESLSELVSLSTTFDDHLLMQVRRAAISTFDRDNPLRHSYVRKRWQGLAA
jgi:hypothetical protein